MAFFEKIGSDPLFTTLKEEPYWLCWIGLLGFAILFAFWIVYSRRRAQEETRKLRKELKELQENIKSLRGRSQANLQMVRQVVDGFENILTDIRHSIDEEEKKIGAIPVSKNIVAEENPNAEKKLSER